MKVLILAGGYGTRLSEETNLKPKPMVEIGGKPILWHIMKIYSSQGFNEFIILLGYRGYVIKEYFANYFLHQSDVTIDLSSNQIKVHNNTSEPWKVTLLDTGLHTMTGGRIQQARPYLNEEPFMLTYGDGVSNVDLKALKAFHEAHTGDITMTSVQPDGRFGIIVTGNNEQIVSFKEKPKVDEGWINGGFFMCNPEVIDYIEGSETVFEQAPLENLAKDGKLYTYRHNGFWKCMDTLRDKKQLDDMWESGHSPWKIW